MMTMCLLILYSMYVLSKIYATPLPYNIYTYLTRCMFVNDQGNFATVHYLHKLNIIYHASN